MVMRLQQDKQREEKEEALKVTVLLIKSEKAKIIELGNGSCPYFTFSSVKTLAIRGNVSHYSLVFSSYPPRAKGNDLVDHDLFPCLGRGTIVIES